MKYIFFGAEKIGKFQKSETKRKIRMKFKFIK